MYEVWGRFQLKLLKGLNHEMTENIILQGFYRALEKTNKAILDNAFDKSSVKSSYRIASKVLDQVSSLARGWHMKDVEVVDGALSLSFMCQYQICKEEERDSTMIKLLSYLELLIKYKLGTSV